MSILLDESYQGILVSVVIATHGRPDQLIDCLGCLQRQTFPMDNFEIIVVDDGSPQPIKLMKSNSPESNIKLIRNDEKQGPGAARNRGVRVALGELIAFTDDDCLPQPDWLAQFWDAHQSNPDVMLGGKLYNAVPEYPGAQASQVISDIVYAWYNNDPSNARFFSTNNLAVPRAPLLYLDAFNVAFKGASEDRDLCDRWRSSGRRMQFVPAAIVGHAHRLTVKKFIRQHFSYGRGAAIFHRERADRGTGRIVDEMPFHRALPRLLWKRLSHESPAYKVSLTFLIVIWQVANAAGYAWERMQTRRRT